MNKEKQNKAPLFSPKNIVIDFIRVTGAIPTLLLLRPKKIFMSEKAKEKEKPTTEQVSIERSEGRKGQGKQTGKNATIY